jgi:small subunit ribosomal protein S2
MKRYIFGSRNGIYIVDLQQTLERFRVAYDFVRRTTARGAHILFVGTKKQAQDIVGAEAARAQQFYVSQRWLGGMLTNFTTIKNSLGRLKDFEHMQEMGMWETLPKKEVLQLQKKADKLEKLLGGIKSMESLPGALFVIDCKKEKIAISEAKKLGIPTVAVVDTNCDPDDIDYVIPGNDDAIRAIRLMTSQIAQAAMDGLHERQAVSQVEDSPDSTPADESGATAGKAEAENAAETAESAEPAVAVADSGQADTPEEVPASE